MSGTKNRSVDQGKSTDTKGSKILELNEQAELVDLKNEHLMDVRHEIQNGRERLYRRRVNERSPDDQKSRSSKPKSKASKKANFGNTGASGGFASINES
jgi:hypothetical protein